MNPQNITSNPITQLTNTSLIDLPTPSSISFLWNLGFLLGITFTLQLTTGILLSILYSPDVTNAFTNIVNISQDNQTGWATRLLHTNGASLFFILLYAHTARGIYFNSPTNQQNTWVSGIILIILIIATAFLGYVLPWGQISFWGATVITGVLSAIPILGPDLVIWIWGGPAVSNPTLNRFFSLHFLLPILISITILIHLILLHENGSSSPSNSLQHPDNLNFSPLFLINDLLPTTTISLLIITILSLSPNLLTDVENFNIANPLIAPLHIQPEWYFLFAYVILRSVPSKLGGVLALVASIIILAAPATQSSNPTNFNPTNNSNIALLISTIIILTWIGSNPVEAPYESIGQTYSILYFLIFLLP